MSRTPTGYQARENVVRAGSVLTPPKNESFGAIEAHAANPSPCRVQVRSGQVRSGQVRSGQVRSGQVRSGQVRSGQVRSGQVRSGQVRSGQVRPGQVRSGQVRSGQVRSGQVRSGQAKECGFDNGDNNNQQGILIAPVRCGHFGSIESSCPGGFFCVPMKTSCNAAQGMAQRRVVPSMVAVVDGSTAAISSVASFTPTSAAEGIRQRSRSQSTPSSHPHSEVPVPKPAVSTTRTSPAESESEAAANLAKLEAA